MSRRRRTSSTSLQIVVTTVVALPVVAALATWLLFDPNSIKPRIVDAVRAATGRELVLQGPLSIGLSLQPTLQAQDVRLSNPTGFSRLDMATLSKVEARLALWPLMRGRVEIVRLDVTNPDVMLETSASGQNNWRFAPAAHRQTPPRAAQAPAPVTAPAPTGAPSFAVGEVRVMEGKLTWRDARSDQTRSALINQFSAESAGAQAAVSAKADVSVDGHAVALSAETGPIEALMGGEAGVRGWPLQVVARVDGARLSASGTVGLPLEGRLYRLTLDATAPDLSALGWLVGQKLPPLRDVSASAKVSDDSGAPVASAIALHAGAADLADLAPGLSMERLELSAPALDQAAHMELDGLFGGTKWRAAGTLGRLSFLAPHRRSDAVPVDLAFSAGDATLTAKGVIVGPDGFDVALAGQVPDVATLSGLAGRPLPSLRGLAFEVRASDPGGLAQGVVLHNLKLAGANGDVAGDLTIARQPRLAFRGQLSGKSLDLDGVLAAIPDALSAPRLVAASPAPAAPAQAPAPVPGAKRFISGRPFNLAVLDRQDVDLRWAFGEVRSGGAVYRDVIGRLDLAQGKAALDPFTATLPGGRMELRAGYDTKDPQLLSLAISAPGLALKPLLTAFGLPDDSSGTIEVAADLTASGNSPYALAASVAGKFGVAMTDGELDNHLLGILVDLLKVAKLPTDMISGGAGRTKLRCFATRIDAVRGVATVSSLVLDASRLLVQGGGVVNLADETLAMKIRPLLRTGGAGIVLPVRMTGSLTRPNVALDAGGALEGLAGNFAGLGRKPVATLGNAAAGERGGDACGPAVAAARGARPNFK